ncbi:hypothetical protein JCM8202_003192 [Rhodotorula sphaerocarpa]
MQSFFASPTVRVSVDEDVVFLNPLEGDFPTQDPELRGHVVLTLPSRKAVKSIKVVLEGTSDVWGGEGYPYETTTALKKELDLKLGGEQLEAGQHTFGFDFIVSSSADPSQRCSYGRTRYFVKAAVQFDSRLSNALVSPPENIWLSPLQTPPEELPRITDCITHHFDEKLGPLSVGFSSPHLTVAGLGSVSLTLHDPPARLLLLSLVATIVQRFKIIYDNGQVVEPREARYVLPKVNVQQRPAPTPPSRGESPAPRGRDPGRRSEPPSPLDSPRLAAFTRSPPTSRSASPLQRRHPVEPELYTPDPVPLAQVEAGQQYHHSRICRIPDANHVRPSTLTGSKTKIVVSHRMHVEVRYRPEGAETDLRLVVEQPITISGCSSLSDNFRLPAYGEAARAASPADADPAPRSLHAHCMCCLSLKDLLDYEGEVYRIAANSGWGSAGEGERSWRGERQLRREERADPSRGSGTKSPAYSPM